MAEGKFLQEGLSLDYTAVAAVVAGDIVQHPSGLAGIVNYDAAAGAKTSVRVSGVVTLPKTTNIALLQGGDAYWDVSAGKTHYRPEAGTPDYFVGGILADANAAATTVDIVLNSRTRYTIDLERGGQEWTPEELTGTGGSYNVLPGVPVQLVLSNANEAQQVALKSVHTIPASAKGIAEFRVAQFAASDNTVDIDFGIASGSHATDFEAVTAFAAFHQDGGDVNISTHSDDNTTDRAPADSTLDHVDDAYSEYWIDFRDDTNVLFYVNGVLVDTSATKRILTGALATAMLLILMMEKTAGTATGEVRASRMRARTLAE